MIPINEPCIGKEEIVNVVNALLNNEVSGAYGNYINDFEKVVAFYCNKMKYGISTSSGTAALHLALLSLNIGKGDEVIIPNMTMAATAFAVMYTGAKPISVDVDKDTWCIDTSKIEEAITDKTRVIMPVHLYGNPCNMGALYDICDEHDIEIIEDCAEALGATYRNQKVGSFGIANCFSFYGTKMITSGEGGMILTNNKCIFHNTRDLRNMAFGSEERYKHDRIGYNYRLSNILAAIGLAQIHQLDAKVELKRQIFDRYEELLPDIDFQKETVNGKSCRWVTAAISEGSYEIRKILSKKDVFTGDIFTPMHKQGFIKVKGDFPISEEIYKKGFILPSDIKNNIDAITEGIVS